MSVTWTLDLKQKCCIDLISWSCRSPPWLLFSVCSDSGRMWEQYIDYYLSRKHSYCYTASQLRTSIKLDMFHERTWLSDELHVSKVTWNRHQFVRWFTYTRDLVMISCSKYLSWVMGRHYYLGEDSISHQKLKEPGSKLLLLASAQRWFLLIFRHTIFAARSPTDENLSKGCMFRDSNADLRPLDAWMTSQKRPAV